MSDTLRRSFILLALGAACMAALLAFLPASGHDQIWFLLMARRWLSGATLYGPQIFDSNPPMIVWVSAIPVALGSPLHVPATTLAKALVLAASAAIAFFCAKLLPRTWRRVDRSEWPALAFACIVLFLVVPARDLGQRDALIAFLVIPYVLCASARLTLHTRFGARATAALLAALAFCLKPHTALIALAIEAAVLLRTRRSATSIRPWAASPEPWILIATGAMYLLAIRLLAPLYFTEALPILRSTYWAIGHLSFFDLLWQAIELTLLAAVTLTIALRSTQVSNTVRTLLLAGGAAYIAYLLQGTGWYYQQLPAISLFGAALALQLLDLQRSHRLSPARWTVGAVAVLCLVAVGLTTYFTGCPFTRDRAFAITTPDPNFFANLPPGTPVAILTTSVDEAMMPVERYHLTWAQRTDNLWLMPALLRSESPVRGRPARQRLTPSKLYWLDPLQHRWMVEDLTRWQPQQVLVERCQDPTVACQELEDRHDNLLAWFQRDPAFNAVWQNYRYAGTRGRFDAYLRR